MKYLIIQYFPLLFILSLILACNSNKQQPMPPISPQKIKEPFLHANKNLNKTEEEEIQNYITRYGWNMNKTSTGLRYLIYKKTNGQQAQIGQIVRINYRVSLINGNLCYDSEQNGPKEFCIGKRQVESGLEEAMLYLKVGEKAKLIIPSHLAFGLIGDDNKIPKRAILIYDVELCQLKK